MGFRLKSYISGAHFEGMLITLCGYCIIGISLVLIHGVTALLRYGVLKYNLPSIH